MGISIRGIGVLGGFGCGVTDLLACLEKGTTPSKEFPPNRHKEAAYGPAFLADASCLETFVPKKSLRRIDHFSQMAILGACLALKDAGMPSLTGQRAGLVVCSGYGASNTTFSFLDSIIDNGDVCASPTLFSNSVHNSAAGHISILLELDGPCLTVSQFEISVPSALLSACRWLQEGRVDLVLFGAVDEYCDVLGYCRQRFFGDHQGLMTPLSPDLNSAIPGEGAAFFLLSRDKEDASGYGSIVDIQVGGSLSKSISFPKNGFFFLGADGHMRCDSLYRDFLPSGTEAACYSPLYGTLPTGPAFDMTIAALSLKNGKIFASPESVSDHGGCRIIKEDSPIASKSISCLKIGKEGEWGIITLAPE